MMLDNKKITKDIKKVIKLFNKYSKHNKAQLLSISLSNNDTNNALAIAACLSSQSCNVQISNEHIEAAIYAINGNFTQLDNFNNQKIVAALVAFVNALNKKKTYLVSSTNDKAEEQLLFCKHCFDGFDFTFGSDYKCDVVCISAQQLCRDYLNDNFIKNYQDKKIKDLEFVILTDADQILINNGTKDITFKAPAPESWDYGINLNFIVNTLLPENELNHIEAKNTFYKQIINRHRRNNLKFKLDFSFEENQDYIKKDGHVYFIDKKTNKIIDNDTTSNNNINDKEKTYGIVYYQTFFALFKKMICLSNVISNADDILRIFDLNPVVVSSSINAYNEHEIPNCSSYYETYCYNSTITSYQQNFFVERNKILQVKSYVDLVSNMVNALTDNFIDYFFVNRTDKEVEEAIGIINECLFNADLVPSILLKNTSISDTKINFNKIINIVIAKHVELWSEQKTNELFKNIVVNCYDKCWASYLAFILWLKDFAPNHNTESSTPLEFFNRTCADFYEEFKRNVIFCVIENINKDNSEKINDEIHLAFCTLLKQINVEQKVYDEYVNKYNNSKQQAKQNESGKRIDVAFKPNGEVEIISSMDFKENKPLSPELQRVLKGALQNIYGRMVRLKKSPNNKDDDEKK